MDDAKVIARSESPASNRRQRWRDLMALAADIAFETDAAGRFVFIAPPIALGWPADTLLGQQAALLLAGDTAPEHDFDPFRVEAPVRGRRAWMRRRDGGLACLSFAVTPLLDDSGYLIGVRGVGQDVTEQSASEQAVSALRRTDVMEQILLKMRQEVEAPRMMQVTLEAVTSAMSAAGAAVIDVASETVLHESGNYTASMLPIALLMLREGNRTDSEGTAPDRRKLLVCSCQTRFGEQAGLVVWRDPAARGWDASDHALLGPITSLVRVILEHEWIQQEMGRQARTDPLTGLLNTWAFREELGRRMERLDREWLPGTLMVLSLENFRELNETRGQEIGEDALCITANLLRAAVRPADLVARLNGDEFALWMDGADELAAAERAELLRIEGPRSLAHLCDEDGPCAGVSIGIATRWPNGADMDVLLQRADKAMHEVRGSGRSQWRVSHAE